MAPGVDGKEGWWYSSMSTGQSSGSIPGVDGNGGGVPMYVIRLLVDETATRGMTHDTQQQSKGLKLETIIFAWGRGTVVIIVC